MRTSISIPLTTTAPRGLTDTRAVKSEILKRDRSKPHYTRKFYHMVMGLICFSLYAFLLDRTQALWTIALVGGTWVACDILRVLSPRCNEIGMRLFGHLMRREEVSRLSANSFFIVGLFFVTLFFPKVVTLLCILFLAVGDPIAAIVGTLYGKHKIGATKKSVEGAAANFFVSGAISALFATYYLHAAPEKVLLLSFMGAMISTLAELIPVPGDDNFSIPVVSGLLFSVVNLIIPVLR